MKVHASEKSQQQTVTTTTTTTQADSSGEQLANICVPCWNLDEDDMSILTNLTMQQLQKSSQKPNPEDTTTPFPKYEEKRSSGSSTNTNSAATSVPGNKSKRKFKKRFEDDVYSSSSGEEMAGSSSQEKMKRRGSKKDGRVSKDSLNAMSRRSENSSPSILSSRIAANFNPQQYDDENDDEDHDSRTKKSVTRSKSQEDYIEDYYVSDKLLGSRSQSMIELGSSIEESFHDKQKGPVSRILQVS